MPRQEFILYQFLQPRMEASPMHYSLAPAAMVETCFTRKQMVEEFGGWTEFWHETTGESWIGIWGERKATRFRRMLKERGATFRITQTAPPPELQWRISIKGEHAAEHLDAPSQTDRVNAASFGPQADNVFARIATRYDVLCDMFSFFIHRYWKSRLAKRIAAQEAEIVLDAASGTGHIAQRVLRRLNKSGSNGTIKELLVTDLCPQMLAVAKAKKFMDDRRIRYALIDAHDMKEIADNSVDLFSIAFAMKICNRQRVVAEAMRVLKPGGQFFCLEASRIPSPLVQRFYLTYMNVCLPLMGWVATSGDRSAYDYLLRGIHAFPAAPEFAQELREVGFSEVGYENLTLGIVAMHWGRKPH